jgi:beta-galactosidase
VVTTYVEWSLHNPKDGVYDFTGMADIEQFVELAAQEDLYVILRPGPYICAERDMGGFPYWLLHKYPSIQLRTFDLSKLVKLEKIAKPCNRISLFLQITDMKCKFGTKC